MGATMMRDMTVDRGSRPKPAGPRLWSGTVQFEPAGVQPRRPKPDGLRPAGSRQRRLLPSGWRPGGSDTPGAEPAESGPTIRAQPAPAGAGSEFRPRTQAGRRALARRRRRRTGPPGGAVAVVVRREFVRRGSVGRGVRVSAETVPVSAPREAVIGRWGRLASTFTVGVVLLSVASTMLHPAPRVSLVPVRVEPGDTLITMARAAQPDIDPGPVVEEIKRANALSGGDLRPGAVLLVPTEQP